MSKPKDLEQTGEEISKLFSAPEEQAADWPPEKLYLRGYYALKPHRMHQNHPDSPVAFELDELPKDGYSPVAYVPESAIAAAIAKTWEEAAKMRQRGAMVQEYLEKARAAEVKNG